MEVHLDHGGQQMAYVRNSALHNLRVREQPFTGCTPFYLAGPANHYNHRPNPPIVGPTDMQMQPPFHDVFNGNQEFFSEEPRVSRPLYLRTIPLSCSDPNMSAKKLRLAGRLEIRKEPPLSVDVNEPGAAYLPQTEAISPTGPPEDVVKSSKEDLLQQINKVDREIFQTEQRISRLRDKELELQKNAVAPSEDSKSEEPEIPKHLSLAQQIYAENRKKAAESHAFLQKLGKPVEIPLYNQPSDNPCLKEIIEKHRAFQPRLILHLRKVAKERSERRHALAAEYNKKWAEWQREVEKTENSTKRKAREAKHRELFEKTFPEIRKQREDRERFNRVGSRVKSEADMEEIMDGLQEQEMEERKMRAYAVIPPMMLDARERRFKFINTNGIIEDFSKECKERQFFNYWTPDEHDIFKEKYLQQPKNFHMISAFLERKNYQHCIHHYYLTKKQENYKQLLRKSRQGRTRASRGNPAAAKQVTATATAVASTSTAADTISGVTTRLQREQLQKQDPSMPSCSTSVLTVPAGPTVPALPTLRTASVPATTSFVPVVAANHVFTPPPLGAASAVETSAGHSELSEPAKKIRRKGENKNEAVDSSDDDISEGTEKGGAHCCAVCKTTVESYTHSRPLAPRHAQQYGLSEEGLPANARVCNTCRCKAVRSRCMVCPIPTCPNPKGRVKRLRALPSKWADITLEVREGIIKEFQIPTGVNKCCSACFTRISRKLTPFTMSEEDSMRWTDQEIEALKAALKQHGISWHAVAEVVSSRTHQQCKLFYFNSRKKYKLDIIVQEYNRTHLGEDRKPAVTDEEESGSSTSSCDEIPPVGPDTSDTASAGSPEKNLDAPVLLPVKEEVIPGRNDARPHGEKDYDSSATETADEGQTNETVIYPHLPGTSITAVNGPVSSPPRTVKDLMANVIEKQLMKSPGGVSVSCSGTPTITSILNTDPGFKRSSDSLATLSIVNSDDRQAESPVVSSVQDLPKDGLVVVQVSRREPEPETLDLSIKKRESPNPYQSQHGYLPKSNVGYGREQVYYHGNPGKAHPVLQTPHLVMSRVPNPTKPTKHPMMACMPPKLSPKVHHGNATSSKQGSITHGTPVASGTRYDGLLRPMPSSSHDKAGSITQGTPVHQLIPSEKRNASYEYRMRSSPANSSSFNSPYPPARQPTSFPLEQQLISRQNIMSDYITSQQMHAPRRLSMPNEKPESRPVAQMYYSSSPGGLYIANRSPAHSPTPPPLRQGVIQRHNTMQVQSRHEDKAEYSGCEVLNSFVEVAVQQPSLPVPSSNKKHLLHRESHHHEGLGKSMADSVSSSRMHEHSRISSSVDHQRYSQERERDRDRERMICQQEQQRYQHVSRNREVQYQQLHMQRQQQARIDQQRMEHQARMESARIEQASQSRIEFEAKQQRHQQQIAAFIDAQQRGAEREREKERERDWDRDREAARLLIGSYQRERMHQQRAMESQVVSRPMVQPSTPNPPKSEDKGMTAASLIDAIITHQINQTSDSPSPGQSGGPSQTRPGDRLFQSFHRDSQHSAEANGKVSPMKRSGSPLDREPTKAISLAEHIDSIIQKDYGGGFQQFHIQEEQHAWKVRRVLPQKEEPSRDKQEERQIIRIAQPSSSKTVGYHEPVSPPEWPSRFYPEKPPSHLSPLDYVKNRIVEVMRTEDKEADDKAKGRDTPDNQEEGAKTASPSTFPFSFTSIASHISTSQKAEEPAPILSAQYEPLSDED